MPNTVHDRGLGVVPSWAVAPDPLERRTMRLPSLAPRPGAGEQVTRNRDLWFPRHVRDQMRTNGCVGFSGATAQSYADALARKMWAEAGGPAYDADDVPMYSALFGWWIARRPEDRGLNVGCLIRDFAAAATRYGLPLEPEWPMTGAYLNDLAAQPPAAAFAQAARHQAGGTYAIADGDVEAMMDALRAGHTLHYAFPVYESYYDSPHEAKYQKWAGTLVGYHAEWCFDLDVIDGKDGFCTLGSWGDDFAHRGVSYKTREQMLTAFDIKVYTKVELLSA